jgi:hypothetical protein
MNMDKKLIRIVSTGGTAVGTRIYAGDEELSGITKIEFEPLEPGGLLMVRLTAMAEIDVMAHDADDEFAEPATSGD